MDSMPMIHGVNNVTDNTQPYMHYISSTQQVFSTTITLLADTSSPYTLPVAELPHPQQVS